MPTPEFIVIGSGIAGLRAAVELGQGAKRGAVVVLTKAGLDDSATTYAQGGIAAALGEDDSVALHEEDTLRAGDGLCEPEAVRLLVREAPHAIEELLEWGAAFDGRIAGRMPRTAHDLAFTREGAHCRSRVLHAHGDSTGREIAATLLRHARALPAIEFRPHLTAARLIFDEAAGGVTGVECRHLPSGEVVRLQARCALLATGGLGQVYSDTTNPPVATGDGLALAARAGATLADMEFIQFHPTALSLAGAPRFLLSEALRGEGAWLRNAQGERFLPRYDARAELAPRDIVARAIEMEIRRQEQSETAAPAGCFLDATHLDKERLEARFPRIVATLRALGLDLTRQPIPVRPAAHYAMGGVWTDLHGRTTLPGLYAAGEAACTGVHGANRLASNSLLEGLVFGARAARAMLSEGPSPPRGRGGAALPAGPLATSLPRETLQARMWQAAGVLRRGPELGALWEALRSAACRREAGSAAELETANLAITAEAIVAAALAREESRGAHFREDFPQAKPELAGAHSWQEHRGGVRFGPSPPGR